MARGAAARSGDRGGAGIQASRQTLARLAAALAALALTAGLAATIAVGAPRLREPLALAGAFACLSLAVGLAARWPAAIPWSLAVLGAEYAVSLDLRRGPFDGRAPLLAAGFLAAAELAYWSIEPGSRPPGELGRRVLLTGGLAAGALVFAGFFFAASSVAVSGGLAFEALGVAAAVAALAVVAVLAREREPER